MMTYFHTGGPFMWLLLVLLIAILYLTVREALEVFGGLGGEVQGTSRRNAILFWGIFSAVLGFFAQLLGMYHALSAIARARDISPGIIAQGLAESMTTTLFGLIILLTAGLAWILLRQGGLRAGRSTGG